MTTQFSSLPDWFQYVRSNFEAHLGEFAGQPGVQALQLGAYTGDASEWLLTNILTGLGSRLTDVDTWEGSAGEGIHEQLDWDNIWNIYRRRLQGRAVSPMRMTTDQFFEFRRSVHEFDFIYVDGSHEREQVARDLENSHLALKSGGVLAMDDYLWFGHPAGRNPRDAIDPFYAVHVDDYTVIVVNSQLWLRKK